MECSRTILSTSEHSSYCPVAEFCEILQFQMDSEESTGSVELKKILDSFEAGDVLPEADIVCNILDKLGRNLDLASMLLHFTEFQEVVN